MFTSEVCCERIVAINSSIGASTLWRVLPAICRPQAIQRHIHRVLRVGFGALDRSRLHASIVTASFDATVVDQVTAIRYHIG